MQTLFPDLVHTDASTGYLSVYYEKMTPVLAEAIRELNMKVVPMTDLTTANNTFAAQLIAWLGNAENHITRIFTGEVCLTEAGQQSECINRQQLHDLKQLLNNQSGTQPSTPTPQPSPEPDQNSQGSDTSIDPSSQPQETASAPVEEIPSQTSDVQAETPTPDSAN
jgi:hypothetical protein